MASWFVKVLVRVWLHHPCGIRGREPTIMPASTHSSAALSAPDVGELDRQPANIRGPSIHRRPNADVTCQIRECGRRKVNPSFFAKPGSAAPFPT